MVTRTDLFDADAVAATCRHLSVLNDLRDLTLEFLPGDRGPRTFLAGCLNHASARALKSYGTVFLSEDLLVSAPRPIIEAVAIHEVVHLLMGCSVSHAIRLAHPDVLNKLHNTIFPAWLGGAADIRADHDYQSNKDWRDLYDGWTGPTSVSRLTACQAADTYFTMLKQGLVFEKDRRVFSLPPQMLGVAKAPGYESSMSPDKTGHSEILCLITGFELVQYLDECVLATLGCIHAIDFDTWEEAYANYVATSITGTALTDMQRWARQDHCKMHRAALMCAEQPPIEKICIGEMTYEDLATIARQFVEKA